MGGEEVFDFTFLEWLRSFHDAIEEEVPRLVEVSMLTLALGEGERGAIRSP